MRIPEAAADALPGTLAEAAEYARREAESPAAQQFVGGDAWVVIVFLLACIFVVLCLLLEKEKPA